MIRIPVSALALCVGLAACSEKPAAPAPAPANVRAPKAAPAAAADPTRPALVLTAIDGERLDLASERGRWVVVNFWATWCSPCLKEMPDLDALDARRDDLRVFGLAYEDIAPADMRAFLKKHPVRYPIAIVDVFAPPAAFETPRGLPTTHLVAPDGRLAKSFTGPITGAEIEAAIAAHAAPRG